MAFCRSSISQEVLFQKISSSNYPQQRAAHGLHCDRSKHSTLSHAGVWQERPQWIHCSAVSKIQVTAEGRLSWVKAWLLLNENCLPHWKHHLSFSQMEQNNCPCPSQWNHDFPVQQKWTWLNNCTTGYRRLIMQRAQPTGWYYIRYFLKNHILLTIHWEVHCSSLGF